MEGSTHFGVVHPSGIYDITCYGSCGQFKWREHLDNLVTDVGRSNYLEAVFNVTSTASASTWYIGIIGDTTANATLSSTDTMPTHGGWSESTDYSEAARPQWPKGAVGATAVGTLSGTSAAVYSINASATMSGAFLVSKSTKGASTGILHSESKFSQTRNPTSGDTLEVSITQKVT